MRTLTTLAGAVLAATLTQAQTNQSVPKSRYIMLSFVKAGAGQGPEYVRYERQYGKKAGRNLSWKLFAVQSGGDDREYDYVRAVECARFSDLEALLEPDPTLAGVRRPGKLVRQNVLAILESTENWTAAKITWLRVRFMRPHEGKSSELLKQEQEIWKPFFEDRVRANVSMGWAFAAVRLPADDDYPYTRVWFHGTGKLADLEQNTPPELAPKWEPKFRALPMARELRKVVSDELWLLVDQTGERSN